RVRRPRGGGGGFGARRSDPARRPSAVPQPRWRASGRARRRVRRRHRVSRRFLSRALLQAKRRTGMEKRTINATDAPQPIGSYAQAVEIGGGRRTLYISGQIPQTADGKVPEGFPDQCRLAWANLAAQLRAADM